MSQYIALYKCQMCGEMQRLQQSAEGSNDDIEKLLGKIFYYQEHLNQSDLNPVKARIPHRCKDGSLGVSIFAGFKKVQ